MIEAARSADAEIRRLLSMHPRVGRVEPGAEPGVEFESGGRTRAVAVGEASCDLKGLVELMDNNPIVCADRMSVPSAASTLALIALGPVALAGLIVERPTMLINVGADEVEVDAFLKTVGWQDGLTISDEPADLGGVVAATVVAAIRTPERLEEIDELYAERYGHSFYVRLDEDSTWHISLVKDKPHAAYRLRIAPDQPTSLLTIQVMADANGKCGAAQVVHAMNVMAGFEESLGLSG